MTCNVKLCPFCSCINPGILDAEVGFDGLVPIVNITHELAATAKDILLNCSRVTHYTPHKGYEALPVTPKRKEIALMIHDTAFAWNDFLGLRKGYVLATLNFLLKEFGVKQLKKLANSLSFEFSKGVTKEEIAMVLSVEIDCIAEGISSLPPLTKYYDTPLNLKHKLREQIEVVK